MTGMTIEKTCAACPLQFEGTIAGKHFYFRNRWDGWWFGIGDTLDEAVGFAMGYGDGFCRQGDAIDPMPDADAIELINRCILEWQAERVKGL